LWTAVFALAGARNLARSGGLAARVLFSAGWFLGIEAAGARDWRGPLDAVLPLIHTGLAQVRGDALRLRRRWLIHGTAAAAIALCFVGGGERLNLRLAVAFGLLAAAYGWRSLLSRAGETPYLAWIATGLATVAAARAGVRADWRGAAVAAAALALTAGWIAARRLPILRRELDRPALPALAVLAAAGVVGSLAENPFPSWPATVATFLVSLVLIAWWTQARDSAGLAPWLRSAAAAAAVSGYLLGCGTLHLGTPWMGVGAVAIAGAHLAWAMRAKSIVEAVYASAALGAMTIAIFFWGNGPAGAGGVAEMVFLAALWVALAERRGLPWLLVPAVFALLPAVDAGVAAAGYRTAPGAEEPAFAALAAAVGVVSLTIRTFRPAAWAYALQAAALVPAAGAVVAAYGNLQLDVAATAVLAFGAIVYAAGAQERQPWYLPFAAALIVTGLFTLLGSRSADTLLYPAALGTVGVVTWGAGALTGTQLGRRHSLVTMHRILGLSLLIVAALAGFAFPDRTGAHSLGGGLALVALLITAVVLWADAELYGRPQNLYLAVLAASAAGCFVTRELGLNAWELAAPGGAIMGCAVRLRTERRFRVDATVRQAAAAVGMVMVMGWATAETLTGSGAWLVVLLVEGVLAIGAGITLRSRVLLVGGAAALALVSLRALVTVAEAGYLFVAFGAVALTLLVAAAGLALGRERFGPSAGGLREQLSHWE
jgi:hypothetical protein